MALRSPFKCAACDHATSTAQPRCERCQGFLEIPADANYFDLLGLDISLELDEVALRDRFYSLARQTHPDRFASASVSEQLSAARWSTAINRAFQTLRDPVARAQYVLDLFQLPQNESSKVPLELAETYFDLQDKLSEGQSQDIGDFETGIRNQLIGLDAQWPTLQAQFATASDPKKALEPVAKNLTLRRFLNSMLQDIEKRRAP